MLEGSGETHQINIAFSYTEGGRTVNLCNVQAKGSGYGVYAKNVYETEYLRRP